MTVYLLKPAQIPVDPDSAIADFTIARFPNPLPPIGSSTCRNSGVSEALLVKAQLLQKLIPADAFEPFQLVMEGEPTDSDYRFLARLNQINRMMGGNGVEIEIGPEAQAPLDSSDEGE